MKILIFGRGVIGTLYAWAFEKAGHTVEFYVREGRKEAYGTQVDFEIWDTRQSKKDRLAKGLWPIVLHEDIPADQDYDLILLSVNPEQVSNAVAYLAPRIGNATLLFFNNFWRDPLAAVSPIPLDQVVIGFPGAGGGFEGNKLFGGLYKTVQFGAFSPEPTKRELALRELFHGAGFKVHVQKDPQSWLWNHFAMNAAMEIEVLKCGSFAKVASSREALDGIGRNMKDMVPVLVAKGSNLDGMTKVISSLPPRSVGFLMKNFVFSPKGIPYALLAHNQYKVGYAVQEILADARKYNIHVPRLFQVESLISKD